MNYLLNTNFEELSIAVYVKVSSPCTIRIMAADKERPLTVFTNRTKDVKSSEVFYIRMPLSSKKVLLSVYNENKGNLAKGRDNSFQVINIKKFPLQKRTDVGDIKNSSVSSFVDFAQRFSFNASYLKDEQSYQSVDGIYLIEYVPTIISNKTGIELATPARTSQFNGRIQVSKKVFKDYTVPMRMAILLHEFAHFYLNENMKDETEADINSLLIYLGLGYPRIEAYEAFYEVFNNTDSLENKNRFQIIDKFIRDFENKKMVMN
jgi:hypothetical protein